jgi:hypothetical protein
VSRAIEAAVTAGVDIARIETDKAGKIAIIAGGGTGEPGETNRHGDPGWIRTSDLQLRRLLLYPLSYGAATGGL